MNISKQYRQEVLQQLLGKYILGGQVPAPEEIMVRFKQIEKEYPQLGNRSMLSQQTSRLAPRQEVALEEFQATVIDAKLDLKVLRDNLIHSYDELFNMWSVWRSYYRTAEARLLDINEDLSLRLFLNQDSEGFLSFVSDNFKSLDAVDKTSTTAEVITSPGFVKLGSSKSRTYRHKYNPGDATARFVGSTGGGISSVTTVAGTDISNIVLEDTGGWMGVAYSNSPTTASVSISIRLASPKTMNRIVFDRIRRESGAGTIEAFYSSDRISFAPFGQSRSLGDPAVFTRESVEVKELRFNITKTEPDQHRPGLGYYYYFDCEEVMMYKDVLDYADGALGNVQSIAYDVPAYSKAAIEVCEANTPDTVIKYYLSNNGTSWLEVNPTNKAPNALDYVVAFSGLTEKSNIEVGPYDTAKTALNLIRPSDYPDIVSSEPGTALVNFAIPAADTSDAPTSSIRCFEDYKTIPSVDEVEGWKDNGATYSCSFYVDSSDPINLDFGPHNVVIDGVSGAGLRTISGEGWHTIDAPKSSYSFTAAGATNISELRRLDALYPYNVKNIIEGYSYTPSFTGNRLYTGFSKRAGQELNRAASFDEFMSNLSSTFYPSLDINGNMVFFVKRPEDLNDFSNHEYYVGYNVTEDTFNRIYFKAVLESSNSEVTPLLMNYTVKMGF